MLRKSTAILWLIALFAVAAQCFEEEEEEAHRWVRFLRLQILQRDNDDDGVVL